MAVQQERCPASAEERQEPNQEPVRAQLRPILGQVQVLATVRSQERHREQRPAPVQTGSGPRQEPERPGKGQEQLRERASAQVLGQVSNRQMPEERRGIARTEGTGCRRGKLPEQDSTGQLRRAPPAQEQPSLGEAMLGMLGARHRLAARLECSCRLCPSLGRCGSS